MLQPACEPSSSRTREFAVLRCVDDQRVEAADQFLVRDSVTIVTLTAPPSAKAVLDIRRNKWLVFNQQDVRAARKWSCQVPHLLTCHANGGILHLTKT